MVILPDSHGKDLVLSYYNLAGAVLVRQHKNGMGIPQLSTERKRVVAWLLLAIILFGGAFLRFYNLSYAIGTHPDERHMVSVTLDLSPHDMNPHSFAYGSFSYYLVWVFSEVAAYFSPYFGSYDGIFIVGRSVCAIAGLITIFLTYLLTQQLFHKQMAALVAASFLSFNFFHIQLSRYFTSDVLLTTLCIATICSLLAFEQSTKFRYAALTGIFMGTACATKISAIFLGVPLALTFTLLTFVSKRLGLSRALWQLGLVLLISGLMTFVCAPYFVLDFHTFWAHTQEQTNMARGVWRPPYTVQYANTTPYLYHLWQMCNYTIGWPICLAILFGIGKSIVDGFRLREHRYWIVLSWMAVFFLTTAGLQVKFPRYLLPLYPFLFVFAGAVLTKLCEGTYASSSFSHGGSTYGDRFQTFAYNPQNLVPKLGSFRSMVTTTKWAIPALVLLSLAALISCLLLPSAGNNFMFMTWGLALISGISALVVIDWNRNRDSVVTTKELTWTSTEVSIFLFLLTIAVLARCIYLTDLPIFLHNDEMNSGLEARNFLGDNPPGLFSFGWLNTPRLGFFLTGLSMRIFGDDLFGLRMIAAIAGVFSLIGTFLLMRTLFDRFAATICFALCACYHWHLHFSRTGFHSMLALSVSVWSIYLFVLAWQKRSFGFAAGAGSLMGIALQSHSLAFMLPIILPAWAFLGAMTEERSWKWALSSLGILFLFCILSVSPLFTALLHLPNPGAAIANDAFIFAQRNMDHVRSVVGSNELVPVALFQIKKIASFFWETRDASAQYGFSGRFVDLFIWIPFVAGIVWCFWHFKNRGAQLLLIWFFTVIIGEGILTIDPPFAPRMLGIATILASFSAITFSFIMQWSLKREERWSQSILVACGALIAISMCWNAYEYFESYSSQATGERRDRIARLLADEPEVKLVLNLFPQPENFEYESYKFMAPHTRGVNVPTLDELSHGNAINPLGTALVAPLIGFRADEQLPPHVRVAQQRDITDRWNQEGFQWIILKPN